MSNTLEIIRGTVFLILGIALIGFVFWWMLKNSEDPQKFIFRSVLTVVLVLPMFWFALKTGPLAPAIAAVAGLIATFIWGSTVGGLLARPFGNLLAGGDEPPERKPVYSVAQAHRAKNHFTEALAAVRAQLEIFPNDYQGVLLLAQIYAEDFKDLPEAREVIQMFAVGNQESRVNVTNAWLQMADWYVHAGDVQNASDCFQTIIVIRKPTFRRWQGRGWLIWKDFTKRTPTSRWHFDRNRIANKLVLRNRLNQRSRATPMNPNEMLWRKG